MDNTPISGFITRKQASERCKRAERTLQRYWSRAIERKDNAVLKNLKLRTEDGEVLDGKDVTKEKIDDLKKQGKNPTWFVHATWVERKHGPRLEEKAKPVSTPAEEVGEGESDAPMSSDAIMPLLREQIVKLEQDKQDLRDEMKIKNKQIEQANERDKETHILMRDLHGLLHDMQQRLPAPATPVHDNVPAKIIEPEDTHIVDADTQPVNKDDASRSTATDGQSSTQKKKSPSGEYKTAAVITVTDAQPEEGEATPSQAGVKKKSAPEAKRKTKTSATNSHPAIRKVTSRRPSKSRKKSASTHAKKPPAKKKQKTPGILAGFFRW